MTANEGPAPSPREAGPSENSAAAKPLILAPQRSGWADSLIRAGGPGIPDYGSAAWEQLPDEHPAKVAACVIAAECWRTYTDPAEVAFRLRLELDAMRAEAEAPGQWTPDTVAAVHRTATRPRYSELCDRRGEPDRAGRARGHEKRLGLAVFDA